MQAIHVNKPATLNALTFDLSFKFSSIYVASYGSRTYADGARGHVRSHPARKPGRVRVFRPRLSACGVLCHREYLTPTRTLRAWEAATSCVSGSESRFGADAFSSPAAREE